MSSQEWIAQNAPAPPPGPSPPFPFLLPAQAKKTAPAGSPLALEQLYGADAEGVLGHVLDEAHETDANGNRVANPDGGYDKDSQELAWAILSGEKNMKKLERADRHLLDDIAHHHAGGRKKERPVPRPSSKWEPDTSFEQDDGDDPDMDFSPSDSDKRG